jgi:hypothetical protein
MARTIIQIGLAVILIFIGWAVGRAQSSRPAFELVVNAPEGETTIECVKGCELAWVERGVLENTKAATFKYSCSGSPRCSSGRVGGWLTR